jgi:hypothetical protein
VRRSYVPASGRHIEFLSPVFFFSSQIGSSIESCPANSAYSARRYMKDIGFGFNERLFSGGFRSHLHFARFKWVSSEIKRLNAPISSVIELGCFDGKLIGFLPAEPDRYVGFDANWEGGLDLAQDKWAGHPNLVFTEVTTPDQINLRANERFDMAVSMETLEHIPPALIDGYLETIARHLNGYFFITVPNEKGPLFVAK